jgi:hypothetical protein
MRNWLTLLATLFVGSTLSLTGMEARSYFEFDAAYRHDSASWKFLVPSPDPILEDKLHFKDINIFQIGVQGKTMFDCSCCNVYVRASADYGWILDGDVDESFTAFGTETTEEVFATTSLSTQNILDGKYVADLSIGIGFPCYMCDCSVMLAPVVGYSYATQHYQDDIHERASFASNTTPGGIPTISVIDDCCRDNYVNSWYGPFLGIDIGYTPDACLSFYGQFEYHFAHFTGKRDTNIGVDSIDDYHSSTKKAHGAFVKLGVNYMFCDCWYAGLNASYMDLRAHKSSDVGNELAEDGFLPPVVGGRDDHIRTQVKLHSVTLGVAVGRTF